MCIRDRARAALGRIQDFLYELEHGSFPAGRTAEISALLDETKAKFAEGLSDDLNISLALTALFEMIKRLHIRIKDSQIRADDAREAISLVRSLDQVLAVLPPPREDKIPDDLLKRIEAREQARRAKDFKLADEIRKELAAAGVVLEDTKDGVRWKVGR